MKRISGREAKDEGAVLREVERRQAQEAGRYMEIYGIDLGDVSLYDIVLETADWTPAEVVDAIILEAGL